MIGGRFPSSAWMAVTRDESLLNWTVELYRYRDGAWVQARPPKKNDGIFTDIVPWLDGRIVGVTSVVSRDQVAFDLLDGPKLTLMDDVGGTRATDRRCGCARGCGCPLVASGPVVAGERLSVLGRQHRYPSDAKYIMLESFWPSGTVGGYGVFQGDGGHVDVVGAVLLAPNDVVCGANVSTKGGRTTPVVKHAWSQTNPPIDSNRELPTPIDRQLISMAAAPDGTLCVGGENGGDAPNQTRAYCRCGAAPWRRLQLPDQDVTIHRIWLRSSDDVWVSGTVRPQDGRSPPVHRLYHSADASSTFRAASGHFARDLVPPFRPPPPGFPGCEHSFVWLGDGTSIPLEWTAPLRNLFGSDGQAKDVQLVEARERGRSHVGVVVPSYKAGIDLVGTMNSKLPGARPRLLCHEPRAVRTIASSVGP